MTGVADTDVKIYGEGGASGVLASQHLRALIGAGVVSADREIDENQIQPASIDLRLGDEAYRVRASFLPGPRATVRDKLDKLQMHRIDLRGGAVLDKGCVYIVPLQERVRLPETLSGMANPKSSTGRLDIFTRLIADRAVEFESVTPGYTGPLYAEISPRTFSVLVQPGTRLNQLRLRQGSAQMTDGQMRELQARLPLVYSDLADIKEGVGFSVDLTPPEIGSNGMGLVGFRAKKHTGLIDVDNVAGYDVEDFWEPLYLPATPNDGLVLNPDEFYILRSKESVTVPLDHAAEMRAYDTRVGEFRVHYAGFFDPGFGHPDVGAVGTRAVLEVRSHEVPFLLEDGQIVGRLVYEPLVEKPDKIYGAAGLGSNYQRQGLKLSKHFRG